MFKKLLAVLTLFLIVNTQSVFAHGGGHGPVSEREAIIIAARITHQFVDFDAGLGFGRLEGSWKKLALETKRVHEKGDGYYIVSVTNKEEGKTLYVLMSIVGEVYDANFSGEFPGLN